MEVDRVTSMEIVTLDTAVVKSLASLHEKDP